MKRLGNRISLGNLICLYINIDDDNKEEDRLFINRLTEDD